VRIPCDNIINSRSYMDWWIICSSEWPLMGTSSLPVVQYIIFCNQSDCSFLLEWGLWLLYTVYYDVRCMMCSLYAISYYLHYSMLFDDIWWYLSERQQVDSCAYNCILYHLEVKGLINAFIWAHNYKISITLRQRLFFVCLFINIAVRWLRNYVTCLKSIIWFKKYILNEVVIVS
jgi:hypothetical protein